MNKIKIEFLGDMRKLTLSEHDVLVVSAKRNLTAEQAALVRSQFQQVFPGRKLVVLACGLELGIIEMPDTKAANDGAH